MAVLLKSKAATRILTVFWKQRKKNLCLKSVKEKET